MSIRPQGKAATVFATVFVVLGAIGLTGYYLTYWADSAAAVLGYPIALFVAPPIIWFIVSASFSHAFLYPTVLRIRPWQLGLVTAIASLAVAAWAMSQPH